LIHGCSCYTGGCRCVRGLALPNNELLLQADEALQSARKEVELLHAQREKYEETMKKAFMRGVCALNLEAMSMFQGEDDQSGGEI